MHNPHTKEKNLEKIINEDNLSEKITSSKALKTAKKYIVDTTAGWAFYTPLIGMSEYLIAGMENEAILKSRLSAMAVHAVIMRPYAKFREYWAKKWNVDNESSKLKKFLVDTSAMILVQTPVYTSILYNAGASPEEMLKALPAGLAIGALSGRPYGYFLDKWRKIYGEKPVLTK